VDLPTILTGIGAIVTAGGGVVLLVREFRRRDRVESDKELDALSRDLHATRADLIAFRRYAFELRGLLADAGIDQPDAPSPHELDDHER